MKAHGSLILIITIMEIKSNIKTSSSKRSEFLSFSGPAMPAAIATNWIPFGFRMGLCLVLLSLFACQEDTIKPAVFGSVFGEVLLMDENIPIEMATISTNPPTSSVFTDEDGRFVFEDIPEGTYSLRAEKSGFLTEVSTVSVFGNRDANVIIRLSKDSLDNAPPSVPMEVSPMDGSQDLPVNLTLEWSASDPDENDELTYTVLLFNEDQTQSSVVTEESLLTSVELNDLDYGTNYFWQVIVNDGKNDPVYSAVWGFRTIEFPDLRFLYTKSENGVYDIYASDELGNAIRLTQNGASNWRPRMNPQRTKIAYISNLNIDPQIYVMDRDGSDAVQVTDIPVSSTGNQFELDFSWSPDGTKLLYMANAKLYTINTDGTGLSLFAQAPFGFTFAECDWTAQGNNVVARTVGVNVYNSSMFVLDESGEYTSQFFSDIPGNSGGPMFSIAGDKVLYTHDVSGFESADGRQLDSRIFIRDLNTNTVVDISIEKQDGTNDLDPRFSPDGSKIIFMNTNNDGISPRHIYIMDLDGFDRELLFENAEMPEWK